MSGTTTTEAQRIEALRLAVQLCAADRIHQSHVRDVAASYARFISEGSTR